MHKQRGFIVESFLLAATLVALTGAAGAVAYTEISKAEGAAPAPVVQPQPAQF